MTYLRVFVLAVSLLLGMAGCATFSKPIDIKRNELFTSYFTVLSPRQKVRPLGEKRWFEIETASGRCYGKMRFVDSAKGFEGYVGFLDIPEEWVIQSDDEEIIVAGERGHSDNLVFSTDGGRTFKFDVRKLPGRVAFVSVRKGMIRVGLFAEPDRDGNGKGYLEWGRLIYSVKVSEGDEGIHYTRKQDLAVSGRHSVDSRGRHPGDPEREKDHRPDSDFDVRTLVVLEAPISKLTGDIGEYRVLRPKGFRFHGFRYLGVDLGAEAAASFAPYIRDVDSLASLELPRATDPVAGSCDGLEYVPENARGKNPARFFSWYWTTKKSQMDWPSPKQASTIQQIYDEWISGQNKTNEYWHLLWGSQ